MNLSDKKSLKQGGFTIVELALALLVIGILSVGLFQMFGTQFKNTKYRESHQKLVYLKKALLSHVSNNGFLPCPDTDGDGRENRNGIACSASQGDVPYVNLGLKAGDAKDAWGNPVLYAVTENVTDGNVICAVSPVKYSANYFCNVNAPVFDRETPPTETQSDPANLTVLNQVGGQPLADQISVVLAARNSNGNIACDIHRPDERENCDGDKDFVQIKRTEDPIFFDDIVMTISGYEVKRPDTFIEAALNGTDGYISQFSDTHEVIAAKIRQYRNDAQGAALTQRILDEDKRLFKSENIMLYQQTCVERQSVFSDPANYLAVNSVDGVISLGGNVSDNLLVNTDIGVSGEVQGGDEINNLYVGGNHYGTINLGLGPNDIVIAGRSYGDIIVGDSNDNIRICQGFEQTVIDNTGDYVTPTELYFYADDSSYEGNFSWYYDEVARNVTIGSETYDVIQARVRIDDYPDNFYGICPRYLSFMPDDNFCLYTIDIETDGLAKAIQPVYFSSPGIEKDTPIWLDVRVDFYGVKYEQREECFNTRWGLYCYNVNVPVTEPVSLPRFYATNVDLDGWKFDNGYEMPRQYEYGWFYDTNNFILDRDSVLRPYSRLNDYVGPYDLLDYINGANVEVIASDRVDTGFPVVNDEPAYPPTMITTEYTDRSSFRFRFGLRLEEDYPDGQYIGRINSTWFGTPQYDNPQQVTVGGTLTLGGGNDTLLIGGDTTRDIYLGDGDNYAYFFADNQQLVVGTSGGDIVTSLGDLGQAAPDPNAEGWDLQGGDNSARVKGTCYAPILVGDGDDIIIVDADVNRDCALVTNGGNDTISVAGTTYVQVDAGSGDDNVFLNIVDSLARNIILGDGFDILTIDGDLGAVSVDAGGGDDIVVIAGRITPGAALSGGLGTDYLELSAYTLNDWNNDVDGIATSTSGFERVRLIDGEVYP